MQDKLLEMSDFGREFEQIIKSGTTNGGLDKSIALVVSFRSNQVCYKVGTTEKAYYKKDLQTAINAYNNL